MLARPAYSSINFGLLPAEVILVGAEMSVGMASRVMAEFVILPSAKGKSYNAGLSWGWLRLGAGVRLGWRWSTARLDGILQ